MQFEPEESGEERRKRQRDYHAFLDAQVEARKQQPAAPEDEVNDRLPILPLSARLKHQPSGPYGIGSASNVAMLGRKGSVLNESTGAGFPDVDHRVEIIRQSEHFSRLEQRLEAEEKRRHLVERKVGVLGQKLENWMADSTISINSLGARDAVVTEVREQTRNLDAELARMREWQHRVETTLSLAPKVHEMTQQQVKALEEEARTRVHSDEARSIRFNQALERVSSEVGNLARRLEAEETGALQRLAKLEAAFTGEAKGAREAIKQLGSQVRALDSDVSGSASRMGLLQQSLRALEKHQKEQHLAAAEAKSTRDETEQLREHVHALIAAVSVSEKKMNSVVQTMRTLESRQQQQKPLARATTGEQVSSERIQESVIEAVNMKLGLLRTSLANEFSGLMGDTAKRAVESTNVPQFMTALRRRVELAEERLNNMADKSFQALDAELTGVRAEVTRLEGLIETGPIAAGLKVLAANMTAAQVAAQNQLTELQDALSAEITARRRNAVRLAEAQAATTEMGWESVVQGASGMRARCLELEELVSRLTRDIQTAQDDLSSQTQNQLAATQERNSRALGKLEEGMAGMRTQIAHQSAEEDKRYTQVTARVDELQALINRNKDLLREAEEKARQAFAAMEAKRQEQAKQFNDKMAGMESEEMVRTEAVQLALREQGHNLKEAAEAERRTSRRRLDEIQAEVKSLEGRMRTLLADAQEDESTRVDSLLKKAQEQIHREIARVRQAIDRVATETHELREKLDTDEISRMDGAEELRRDFSRSAEASESRVRLWTEDRLRKERAAMEESLERGEAESGAVCKRLDKAVETVRKELEAIRSESRANKVALEDSLDERASELGTRLQEIDDGSAKKRQLSELTEETGARIDEVEHRVRQKTQDLGDELEVRLVVSSLVCSVADSAAARKLEQSSSEAVSLDKFRMAGVAEREASLRAELETTKAVVAELQADIKAAAKLKTGMDSLELKLTAQIEELKATAEAARSAAAHAKANASAAVEAQNASALKDAAKLNAKNASALEEAAEPKAGTSDADGQLVKNKSSKKAIDFTAMNDELEAEDEDSPSPSTPPATSSRLSENPDANDYGSNAEGGLKLLTPRVDAIEEELVRLKQRLEEEVAKMDALRREHIAGPALRAPSTSQRGASKPHDEQRQERAHRGEVGVYNGLSQSREDSKREDANDDEGRRNVNDNAPLLPASAAIPIANYTPPLSPKSDFSLETKSASSRSELGFDTENISQSASSGDEVQLASRGDEEGSDPGGDYSDGEASEHPYRKSVSSRSEEEVDVDDDSRTGSSDDEVQPASRRDEAGDDSDGEASRDSGSGSEGTEENGSDAEQETSSERSTEGGERSDARDGGGGDSYQEGASATGSETASETESEAELSNKPRSRSGPASGSETGDLTSGGSEGSFTPRGSGSSGGSGRDEYSERAIDDNEDNRRRRNK